MGSRWRGHTGNAGGEQKAQRDQRQPVTSTSGFRSRDAPAKTAREIARPGTFAQRQSGARVDTGATLYPWWHWSTLIYWSTVSIQDFQKNRKLRARFCGAVSKRIRFGYPIRRSLNSSQRQPGRSQVVSLSLVLRKRDVKPRNFLLSLRYCIQTKRYCVWLYAAPPPTS
jgi:hypothetical protein